ncbi:MAG: hypothetical protein GX663_09940 [Clostridiales bacterium]|nr:hypothetical protein [Clostridiales bacterium]
MKNMITIIPCILLIMACLAQFTCNQIVHYQMAFAQNQVNAFVEIAKQEGCLTDENVSDLRSKIAKGLHINSEDVVVGGTKVRVERGDAISYYVSYPLHNTIAAAALWGMDSSSSTQILSGETTSEHVTWHD